MAEDIQDNDSTGTADDFSMQPVTSTQLAEVGYKASTKQLRVKFQNGSLYEYDGVPKDIFDSILTAPSAGSHFNATVKGNFTYRRLA